MKYNNLRTFMTHPIALIFKSILSITLTIITWQSVFSQTSVNSINELRALLPNSADEVTVAGYYTPEDGGGGVFIWDEHSKLQDNGGTIIIPDSRPAQGRWIRDISGYDYYNVRWFGARGLNNPNHNDHLYIRNAINAAGTANIKRVFIPVGIYQVRDEIRLTSFHNGLEIFGEKVVETRGTIRGVSGLRLVDESKSTVIKRAATGPYGSPLLFYVAGSDIKDITFKRLALNGNRHAIKAMGNDSIGLCEAGIFIFGYGGNLVDNVLIEDVYTYEFEKYIAHEHNYGNGIALWGVKNSVIRRNLSYDNWMHSYATDTAKNVLFEDIEAHSADKPYGYGIDIGTNSENIKVQNFSFHHNSYGGKVAMREGTSPISVKFIDGIFKNNHTVGFWTNTDRPKYTMDVVIENVHIFDNTGYGLLVAEGPVNMTLMNVHAKNNRFFDYYFTEPNITAYGLTSEGFNGEGSHAMVVEGKNQIFNDLLIKNSKKPALNIWRGKVEINGGEILNNRNFGIMLGNGAELTIQNMKFGDTQNNPTQTQYEIYGPDATVKYANIDFNNSKVSSANQIRVNSAIEIAALSLTSPQFGDRMPVGADITISATAYYQNSNITDIIFYANGIEVGRKNSPPYEVIWRNAPIGSHEIYGRARDMAGNVITSNRVLISVVDNIGEDSLPADWENRDIGNVKISGYTSSRDGIFQMNGAGRDIWGNNDEFHYTYKKMENNGNIVARVNSVLTTHPGAKAGLMIRESMNSNSKNAMIFVTPEYGVYFQYRKDNGGNTVDMNIPGIFAPVFLMLERNGDTIVGYYSKNNVDWNEIGKVELNIDRDRDVYIGMGLTSQNESRLSNAIFDNVDINTSAYENLPADWENSDVGNVATSGNATYRNGVFTVSGAGTDIWGAHDQFHYAYTSLNDDTDFIANIESIENSRPGAKAGLMIRESLDSNAKNVMIFVSPEWGVYFQHRRETSGQSSLTGITDVKPPVMLKLERRGSTFTGYYSNNNVDWHMVGSIEIPMKDDVYAGLALTSQFGHQLGQAVFNNVKVEKIEKKIDLISHTISLRQGWNSISSYVNPANNDISQIVDEIQNKIILITDGNGRNYWPDLAINDINEWEYSRSYRVNMREPAAITISGYSIPPQERVIELKKGWNNLAYLLDYPKQVELVLEDIQKNIRIVMDNYGSIYWPEFDINSLEYMQPGEGYKIFVNEDVALIY